MMGLESYTTGKIFKKRCKGLLAEVISDFLTPGRLDGKLLLNIAQNEDNVFSLQNLLTHYYARSESTVCCSIIRSIPSTAGLVHFHVAVE